MCHRLYFSFSSVSFLPHSVVIVLLALRERPPPPSLPSTNQSGSWKALSNANSPFQCPFNSLNPI